jgi:hypothetical protein
MVSERDRETLLKGGTPPHEASSSSGPLRPQVLLKLREILVRQYTPAAWRSHVAWHAYWTEHGYDTLNDELRVASPPRPRSDHRTVRLTWGQVRKWVREEHATLDEAAPQASSDVSRRPGARTLADGGDTSRATGAGHSALRARTRHELDRVADELRRSYADRPVRRRSGDPKWRWSDPHAQAAERAIRELLADFTRGHVLDPRPRAERLLAAAHALSSTAIPRPMPRRAPPRDVSRPSTRRADGSASAPRAASESDRTAGPRRSTAPRAVDRRSRAPG